MLLSLENINHFLLSIWILINIQKDCDPPILQSNQVRIKIR
jgi:hypothetical protein